jgi:hypothetical protein
MYKYSYLCKKFHVGNDDNTCLIFIIFLTFPLMVYLNGFFPLQTKGENPIEDGQSLPPNQFGEIFLQPIM